MSVEGIAGAKAPAPRTEGAPAPRAQEAPARRSEEAREGDTHDAFRDALASVHRDGRRKWVYARQPSGRYYRARTVLSVLLIGFLLGAPFITVHGQPLMLLNVLERRFILFGVAFWPQDFYLIVLIALTLLVTLVVSTASVGRVWCGWLCPQTVFMEMLFRRLEFLIDGSAEQQVRRDRQPQSAAVLARRVFKHALFFTISFGIANVFLAYVIGAPALEAIITDPPQQHLAGLVAITIFSVVFYAVFARFREQACTLACPYGRVMSSLIDPHTITVTYDARRGKPRGRANRAERAGAASPRGDCVDCFQCVTVCPTGIDIRNGIQLECVNCTACMDACDSVMTRLGRPRGLIRLTSERAMREGRRTRWFTPRVQAYAALWLVLAVALGVLMWRRADLDVLVLRQPGTLFTEGSEGRIANFYNVQAFNRTSAAQQFDLTVVEPPGATVTTLGRLNGVGPHSLVEGRLIVQIPRARLTSVSVPLRLAVRADGRIVQEIATSFLGPAAGAAQ
jgi:cytochrome c oxidase accessory protein FixG